jgi:1-acyl-sn-glycerol-3-phosphate acyltransferase/nucleoside-diphosphate-sugar epimerase
MMVEPDGSRQLRVIVAGADDSVTAMIAERMAQSPAVEACRTVRVPGADPAAILRTDPGAVLIYRPPFERRPRLTARPDLAHAAALFQACVRERIRPARILLLSSTRVHTPDHHHAGYVTESHRPRYLDPVSRAWRSLETLAGSVRGEAGVELLVLRLAPVIARDSDDPLARLLSHRVAWTPAGFDPALQLLAPEDLAEAVALAVERGEGEAATYHIVPAGAVTVRGMLRLAGVRRIASPIGSNDALRHPWTASGQAIADDLGFIPRHTSAEAVLRAFGKGKEAAGPAPVFDDYGQDLRYIAAYGRTLFRFLHDAYWRVEHRGLQNVPREGPVVLTGMHRGFMPWDGVMALHLIARELGRHPRFLIHPCLVKFPFLANYMTKLGGVLANQENADRLLTRGEILGMYPEGIHGAFTKYRDAYQLGRFRRDEYVRMALRNRAPIVPFVTVGSAEIYPILARLDWGWWKRLSEWPYFPLGPNFPFPGLPLPSKWHTRFLAPLPVHEMYPPEAAEDSHIVRTISAEVRHRMEEAIREMLARRKSIFFGSVFPDNPEDAEDVMGESPERRAHAAE